MNEETLIIGGPHDGWRVLIPLEAREWRIPISTEPAFELGPSFTASSLKTHTYAVHRCIEADGTIHRVFVSPGTDPLAALIAGYRRP